MNSKITSSSVKSGSQGLNAGTKDNESRTHNNPRSYHDHIQSQFLITTTVNCNSKEWSRSTVLFFLSSLFNLNITKCMDIILIPNNEDWYYWHHCSSVKYKGITIFNTLYRFDIQTGGHTDSIFKVATTLEPTKRKKGVLHYQVPSLLQFVPHITG